jgi:glycosyltransferase involved in cell wall biosynthesis
VNRPLEFWTIGDTRTASTRLRIHQYAPLLAADDLAPRIHAIPHGFAPRLGRFARLAAGGRLLLQKKLFSPLELRWLRARVERLIYDVDDAVYLDQGESSRNQERFGQVTEAADRVIAGNPTLARACTDPARAVVIPTPVDTRLVTPGPPEAREPGLAVWIGSRAGLPSLDLVWPAWERVQARRPGARLAILADRPPPRLPPAATFEPWTAEREADLLRRASVGLMPLLDTPFNRGKCGFKILLYQAAGVAVVASPVGLNADLVRPDEDGFLPADEASWEDALDRLIADPAAARRFGEVGRARVVATHSIQALYPRFRAALLDGWGP